VRYIGFMPPRYRNVMRYAESWVDTGATGYTDIVYRTNSVYDPYVGAGGAGCWGIDEIQAIYSHYIVHGAKLTVTASIPSGTAATDVWFTEVEYPALAASAYLLGAPDGAVMHLTPGVSQTMVLRTTTRRNTPTTNNWDWSAAENANPDVCSYWHIVLRNSAGSANAVNLTVVIDYDTEWFRMKPLENTDA